MGREWPNLGELAPRHTQRPPTYRDPFFPRPCQKKKNRHSIHYSSSCRGKHLIGDIAMVMVKFRPRWLHSLAAIRPPLPVAPHHDFWPSRVNVQPQPSTNTQWRSTARLFKQIQANFGGELISKIDFCIFNVKNAQLIVQAH